MHSPDSPLIDGLFIGFLVLLTIFRGAKLFNVNVYKVKTSKPETTKIENVDEAIKELDHLKEQISQSSRAGVHVTMRKVNWPIGGSASVETEIKNPDEEVKIINDVEESLKNGTPLTPNTKVIVRTHLRKNFQTKFNKKP
jgi:regulatory protein YycI of two-component signal transduction system YycFG